MLCICVREHEGPLIEHVKGGYPRSNYGYQESVFVCNVIVVSLKEFLIEVEKQMAHTHYTTIG